MSRIAAVCDGAVKIVAVKVEGAEYRLFRREDFVNSTWLLVEDAAMEANQNTVIFTDPNSPARAAFYRVEITLPRDSP